MNEIYSYIYSLAVAASAAGIVTALAPDEGQLKKYVKYIAALCVLVMLALPAKTAIAAIAGGVEDAMSALQLEAGSEHTADSAEAALIAQTKQNIETGLGRLLSAKLDCDAEAVAVTVTLDTSNLQAITVSKVDARAPAEYKTIGIEIWLAEQTGCAAGNVVVEWISSES
jgi:hypothetical protein